MSEEEKQEQAAGEKPAPTVADELVEQFGATAEGAFRGDLTVRAPLGRLVSVFRYLAQDRSPRFDMLIDITAVDLIDRPKRFDVVYHFLSLRSGERLRLKVELNDDEEIPSATTFWNAANWAERETYDMYGLKFRGHPYMKRLLMWDGFDGWPLRKDFPLRGKLPPEEHYKEGDISRFRLL